MMKVSTFGGRDSHMFGSSPEGAKGPSEGRGAAVLAGFVVATVAMLIVPLPTALLDVLLTVNLALSVAVLLASVYAEQTMELSTFPPSSS